MESKKQKISIKELSKKFIPTIKKIFSYLKRSDFNSKMKLIGEIVVLILLLCLLKLPFSIVRDLIINAFFSVKISSTLLMNTIYFLFGIPYILLVIYLFVKTIATRYENLEVKEEGKISNTDNMTDTNNTYDTYDTYNTDDAIDTSNTSNISTNITLTEEKNEIKEDVPLQNIETTPTTVIENPIATNNEQEDNINNS